ncbi:glycosyltransferase family 1 protein [Adlercreutzia murintestinalis]|jgi:Glycosyltransferase|uniref:glycosyltransferase family 1 protein n=1 Tax=Adlercreutzia murintestinalis TaxID=2941325 RepID=UPI00204020CC|nr:glycosyltransferase family 1 protein [Adlercreutzia murintestinalis]
MTKPLRVALIMGKMNGGGVESVVMNYCSRIRGENVQFDFVVDSDSQCVPRDWFEGRDNCRLIMVSPYQSLIRYLKELDILFRTEHYDIVHSHINSLSVFPLYAAKRAGIKTRIAHAHSTAGKGEYKRNLLKWVLRRFSGLYPTDRIACSAYAGEWLFGRTASFTVLNNAIDVKRFCFNPDIRKRTREELGIDDDAFVVGHIGRFMYQKNHPFLIDIFKEIHDRQASSRLILVGEGKLKRAVQDKATSEGLGGAVLFLGQRDDVWRLYQAFDIFVLPSFYEGLPVVGVEAQASGLPCVFSEEITEEVKITEKCTVLPLEEGAGVWAETILREGSLHAGNVRSAVGMDAFDIEKEAQRLETFYGNSMKRNN